MMLKPLLRWLYWYGYNFWAGITRWHGARVEPSVQWLGPGTKVLGAGCYIGARTVLSAERGGQIELGESVWVGADCELSAIGRVQIDGHCSLQHRTQIHGDVAIGAGCTGAAGLYVSSGWHEFRHRPALPIRLQDRHKAGLATKLRSAPVRIGDDCWLGIGVVVLPGVTIGRGCIVGANAVVTSDLLPYAIAVGAPAKIVGQRLDFLPPAELDANTDDHVPYFYSGFRQIPSARTDSQPRRVRGGFATLERFVIAAKVSRGANFRLFVDCEESGVVLHGGQAIPVKAGAASVEMFAVPTADDMLHFRWQADGDRPLSDGLVVQALRGVTREVAK